MVSTRSLLTGTLFRSPGEQDGVKNGQKNGDSPNNNRRGGIDWQRLRIYAGRIGVLACILALWELAAALHWVNPTFTSRPSDLWPSFLQFYNSGRLLDDLLATMEAVALSFAIGTISGTVVGLVLGLNPRLDELIGFYFVPLNSIPRIALAPLFILWFGLTITAKVALGVSIVFFILAINSRASVKSLDPDIALMAKLTGLTRNQMLRKILLPSATPTLFAGARLAITYSLLGVIASEMIAARDGLGQDIVLYSSTFEIGQVFVILIMIALIATVADRSLAYAEKRTSRWRPAILASLK